MNEIEVEYTKSGVPKACPGCGHPFHSAGNCHALQAGRCPCEVNMAVHLDIPDQPQQHGAGGVANPVLDAFRRRFVRNREVSELTPFGFFEAGWSESGQEIERLRARCASLEAAIGEQMKDCAVCRVNLRAALDQHATATQEGTHG